MQIDQISLAQTSHPAINKSNKSNPPQAGHFAPEMSVSLSPVFVWGSSSRKAHISINASRVHRWADDVPLTKADETALEKALAPKGLFYEFAMQLLRAEADFRRIHPHVLQTSLQDLDAVNSFRNARAATTKGWLTWAVDPKRGEAESIKVNAIIGRGPLVGSFSGHSITGSIMSHPAGPGKLANPAAAGPLQKWLGTVQFNHREAAKLSVALTKDVDDFTSFIEQFAQSCRALRGQKI